MNTAFKFVLTVFAILCLSSCAKKSKIREGFLITADEDTIHFYGGDFVYDNFGDKPNVEFIGYHEIKKKKSED